MNLYFTSAMMILDRNAMQEQFREDRLADPAALAIIKRISIEVDPKYDIGGDATRHCARVEIITTDSRSVAREVLERPGSPGNPLPPPQLRRKFETLAGAVLPPDRIARIIDTVHALEDSDARTLTGLATLGGTP
jgi:2-methylcitrate dehydratase PrpD